MFLFVLRTVLKYTAQWTQPLYPWLSNDALNLFSTVPKWLGVSSGCVLALLRWISSFHGSLFPHLTVSNSQPFTTHPAPHMHVVYARKCLLLENCGVLPF